MSDDLDWPLNASRGLSVSAELLVCLSSQYFLSKSVQCGQRSSKVSKSRTFGLKVWSWTRERQRADRAVVGRPQAARRSVRHCELSEQATPRPPFIPISQPGGLYGTVSSPSRPFHLRLYRYISARNHPISGYFSFSLHRKQQSQVLVL